MPCQILETAGGSQPEISDTVCEQRHVTTKGSSRNEYRSFAVDAVVTFIKDGMPGTVRAPIVGTPTQQACWQINSPCLSIMSRCDQCHANFGTVIDHVCAKKENMKKHLVLIAFAMAGTIAFAQEKGKGRHHRDVAGEMKKELSLNDDQYERITKIDESYRAKFHDLRIDSARSKEDKMKAMKSLGEARKKEVEGVLTPEQRSAWQEHQAARRDERRAHSDKVANDRALKIKSDLSMSDKQFEKFEKANQDFRQKAKALRNKSANDKSLTDEQRKAEFKKLRSAYEKEMRSILNKEQYRKWTDMKNERRGHHGKGKQQG